MPCSFIIPQRWSPESLTLFVLNHLACVTLTTHMMAKLVERLLDKPNFTSLLLPTIKNGLQVPSTKMT